MKNKLTNKNGITLIALVITIIVLLILAGISISMITSQDGILNKGTGAKETQKKATEKEKLNLAVQSVMINEDGEIKKEDLRTELDKQFGSGNYKFNSDDMTIKLDEIVYEIKDGEVKEKKVDQSDDEVIRIGNTTNYTWSRNGGKIINWSYENFLQELVDGITYMVEFPEGNYADHSVGINGKTLNFSTVAITDYIPSFEVIVKASNGEQKTVTLVGGEMK